MTATRETKVKTLFALVAVQIVIVSAANADPASGTKVEYGTGGGPQNVVRSYLSNAYNPTSGMLGLHLDRPAAQRTPHGISLDLDGQPVWDTCAIDFEWPDLVLAYSHTLKADNLRLRSDTAQME